MTFGDLLTFPGWIALLFAIWLTLALFGALAAAIVYGVDRGAARIWQRRR